MKPKKTVFFCINGIHNDPSSQRGWTDEFVTSLNVNTPDWIQAEKFEYYTTALFRRWGQDKRASELARKILLYSNKNYRIVLVGHSNGCDLIARVLNLGVRVDSVHLFAAATDEKFFVSAIEGNLVKRIHLYGSPDDLALKTANWTGKFLRLFGLGYGSLGLNAKNLVERFPKNVQDHSIKGYGHSTWFKEEYINHTISLLLKNENGDRLLPK